MTSILVADDDLVFRRSIASRLASTCDKVIEVATAEIAVYLCGAEEIDLVVASGRLPGLGARGLCAELRLGGPPVIAYHLGDDPDVHIEWIADGGADGVSGDDPALLVARCRAILRREAVRRSTRPSPRHHSL